jgi:predicted glycosyltransferase
LLREAEALGLPAVSTDAGIVGVEKNRDLNALMPRPAERSGVVEPLGPGV